MTLALVLVAGWFVLSLTCFAIGTGLMRPEQQRPAAEPQRASFVPVPQPRRAAADVLTPV